MPGGKGNIKGTEGNTFSKDNQPSAQAKSEGHKRKKALKDLADALISGERLEKCKVIAKKVGIDLNDGEYTLDIAMTLRQIEKAFDEGDTRAYQAAMDRLLGKPPQQINQVTNMINLKTID
jgi:cell division protein YceG involved in septum cleavage